MFAVRINELNVSWKFPFSFVFIKKAAYTLLMRDINQTSENT